MVEEKKFYTCKNDIAFKEVFMEEKNSDLLKALLESILDIKIKNIKYLNLEKNNGNIHIKRKHFDFHIKTDTENIHIEVNSEMHSYVRPRNTAYICNSYSIETLRGENYTENIKFIQINLNYKISKKEKPIRIYTLSDEEGKKYVNNLFIYEFNMEYFKEMWYSNKKEIDNYKYLVMLDLEKDELENLSKEDKVIKKYMSEVERINDDPEIYEYMSAEEDNRKIENTMREYWKEEGLRDGREEGIKEGRKEGIKEGIKEGKREANREAAINFLKNGIDIDIISKSLGYSKEELEIMIQEVNNK